MTAILDKSKLQQLCNGDRERIQRYIRIFLSQEQSFMEGMTAIEADPDMQKLRKLLHHIIPQLSYTGLMETHALFEKAQVIFHESNDHAHININAELALLQHSLSEGCRVLKAWNEEMLQK